MYSPLLNTRETKEGSYLQYIHAIYVWWVYSPLLSMRETKAVTYKSPYNFYIEENSYENEY